MKRHYIDPFTVILFLVIAVILIIMLCSQRPPPQSEETKINVVSVDSLYYIFLQNRVALFESAVYILEEDDPRLTPIVRAFMEQDSIWFELVNDK